MAVEWQEEWAFGDDRIDAEHISLIMQVNRIAVLIDHGADKATLSALVQTLLRSAEDHFTYEEDLMAATDYHDAADHCDAHQRLLCSARLIASSLLTNHEVTEADNIGKYLEGWLVMHIEKEDALFSTFLAGIDNTEVIENMLA